MAEIRGSDQFCSVLSPLRVGKSDCAVSFAMFRFSSHEIDSRRAACRCFAWSTRRIVSAGFD